MVIAACGSGAAHRGRTVVYASGADLQSVNPLLTVHPLAKQVERYVLLTTLVRYDSTLVSRPYLARVWTWSEDRKSLTFRLQPGVRWGDGVPTTARDVAWTLSAARDAATGYPRLNDFADVAFVNDPNDSTVVIRFAHSQDAIPDVLTDLAILRARWSGSSSSSWTSRRPSSPRSRRARSISPGSNPRMPRSSARTRRSRCSITR